MSEIEGYILAGGASSRMGSDKAHLRLGGETLVGRAARALRAVAGRTHVVSSKPDAEAFGLPVVPDVRQGLGALGGLHAALAHARAGWAAVLSCDLPFVTGEFLSRLTSLRGPDDDAVAPLQLDGRPQPLCALYAPARSRTALDELLRAGELRPRVLLARLRTRWVGPDGWKDLAGAELFFHNVNTPEEFARAKTIFDSRFLIL
jgi:molybdopterin-guanine dinucleotide biosynthesis protein A